MKERFGPELWERLEHLDRTRHDRPRAGRGRAPDRDARVDADVVIAGGGLWSILAPILADRGLSVVVVERAQAGVAHREWNASAPELEALVRAGLVTAEELEALIVARYRVGTCAFHRGGTWPVRGVLDHAVDAGGLLALARRRAEERGVRFLDRHELVSESSGPRAIALGLRGEVTSLTARVLVDARGAASPYAGADLVCPTVGGVLSGLAVGSGPREIDPEVGEILATVDPIEDGRQHVWEGFPGRPGETTVYLFYYARADEPASLRTLFERFFTTLPTYKRGDAAMLRPTFGFIPGWSRLGPPPAPPPGRVLLVGDAAARHSPLTYCGFGATLRSLTPAAELVTRAASTEGPVPPHAMTDAPAHALTGALAHVLASRAFRGNALNELLDAAFASLHAMGPKYGALLRDELPAGDLLAFLRRTAARHPAVWTGVMRGLGLRRASRWGLTALRAGLGDGA